ncbi:MAG: hypothetical protein ABJO57_14395 [Lentilitoribacter sp.]
MKYYYFNCVISFFLAALYVQTARADLMFYPINLDSGGTALFIEGTFSKNDDLTALKDLLNSPKVNFVSFNSVGGNVEKAMELGRAIRQANKDTIQIRRNNCESACALAFYGGVYRGAEAGSIGVHRSSLPDDINITAQGAVESIQIHIARITTYLLEMGVDPSLLELTLQYGSDDIRYLSNSEMVRYSVTTPIHKPAARNPNASYNEPTLQNTTPSKTDQLLEVPKATQANVRHAKGSAPLKLYAKNNSPSLAIIKNGGDVKILTDNRPWFKVWHKGKTGFMHVTWLWIQNYEATKYDNSRFIQIKSFDNLYDTKLFVRNAPLPVEAYLASNNWFSIVLDKKYNLKEALNLVKALKRKNIVPKDSFVTLGNTYVRKVCCD